MKEEEGQGSLVAKSKGAVEKYDFDSENIYIKVTLKLWFFVIISYPWQISRAVFQTRTKRSDPTYSNTGFPVTVDRGL